MNKLIILSLTLLISSCANLDTNNIAPGYRDAYSTVKEYLFGSENNLTPELIDNIPYASATLQIGRGPKGLIILESIIGEEYFWISADGIIIVLDEFGKIKKTKGLINNLDNLDSSVKNMNKLVNNSTYINYFSFSPPKLNLLPVRSSFRVYQSKEYKLLKGNKYLKKVEENLFSKDIRWKRKNEYYIDKNGFIWKSKQYISPKLPAFEIEITKKPAR
tara:strand:+ start:138 stop:791 length:654 start_codon:yes stop_codon:yes gene_type:complete